MKTSGSRAAIAGAGLLAWLLSAPIAGQQTASIAGRVVDDRGAPVPGARVGVVRGDAWDRTSVTTSADADGRFVLDNLPAATYTLALSKPGHANTAFGRAFYGAAATGIPLRDGERREVTARLPRSAVIAGVIRGDHGAPEPGVRVWAQQWVLLRNQRPSLRTVGRSNPTNSRGEYRIWDLAPGRYIITAESSSARVQIADMRALDQEFRRPPRHYPGVNDPALAQPVSVGPGEDVPGIDISLATEPAGTLVVDVVNPTSMVPTSPATVAWHAASGDESQGDYRRQADAASDGRFVMRAVPAGQHVVTARANLRGERGRMSTSLWAAVPVSTTAGTDEITLTLEPGATIAGRILSRDDPRDLDIRSIGPAFLPVGISPWGDRFSQTTSRSLDSHFEVTMPPGEYRLEVHGLPAGWIALEAIVNGRDMLDGTVVVRPGERIESMVIVVSHRPASAAGTVVNADGSPAYLDLVVMFPTRHDLRRVASRWIRVTQPDLDGRYALDDLPPGEYFVLAAPIDWNPALEPERLRELEAMARSIRLPAGEQVQFALPGGR